MKKKEKNNKIAKITIKRRAIMSTERQRTIRDCYDKLYTELLDSLEIDKLQET